MITYKTFKANIGVNSLKWGNCSTGKRAMVIYDGVKLFSKEGLLTQQIEKIADEDLYIYAGTYKDTDEPVLWLTDKSGLKDIIEK